MATADLSITTTNPTIAAAATGQATAAVSINTSNPVFAVSATGQASASTSITTSNPTVAISATGQESATVTVTTTNPTVAANLTGQITADTSITTNNPVITGSVTGQSSVTIAVTTNNPTIEISATRTYVADTTITTTNPVITGSAIGQASVGVAITPPNPTFAATESATDSVNVAINTNNPTIVVDTIGQATANANITTSVPTIGISATGQASASVSVTTSNPTIDITATRWHLMDAAITTANPIITASATGQASIGISVIVPKPVVSIGLTSQDVVTVAIIGANPTVIASAATVSAAVTFLPPTPPPATPTPIAPPRECKLTSNWALCKPWDISTQQKTNNLADLYNQEQLAIAGAQVNIYKLLGIHEQTMLTDLTGQGSPISGGDAPNRPASNAFDKLNTEWQSRQSGSNLITSGYIGYDFGIIKLPNGRNRYGIDAGVYHEITTLKIKQSSDPLSRVTKARVERSLNGTEWFGVAIITLPNDDNLNTIHFKQSAPARYWRLRPLEFTGSGCNNWGVKALELIEYAFTDTSNIQDKILLENRDRDYDASATTVKGFYELNQANTNLKQFGIELEANYSIKVNFNTCVALLGRPVIIGDIIELPSEQQYTTALRPVKRYLEVTDVTWDPSSYTPGWLPLMLLVTAMPALASQETQDIFGDLSPSVDSSGLFHDPDGNSLMYQDFTNIDQAIKVGALNNVPERGSEGSNTIREFEDSALAAADSVGINLRPMNFNRTGLYVEDALPQNGAPYTEGPEMPATPKNGDYHRLTYVGLSKDVPARLYRFSLSSNRWIYLETDRRAEFNNQTKLLTEYVTSPNKTPARDIK